MLTTMAASAAALQPPTHASTSGPSAGDGATSARGVFYLLRLEEAHVLAQLVVAAVLAVGHEVHLQV